jgi:protein phosphatase
MASIKFNSYEGTNVGLKRSANEDSYGHMEIPGKGYLYIVCDGMGGHVGGAEASRSAVQFIKDYFDTHELKNVPELSINDAIAFANTQIFYKSSIDSAFSGMGTTCTLVLLLNSGKAYYAHVGDSRIYLYSGGKMHRLTKDHSFVQTLVDMGSISEGDAENHPLKNQITRALGIEERVEPDMPSSPAQLSKGDMLLLCTDGLTGMTTEEKIAMQLKSCADSDPVPNLIRLALEGGGKDNITATVLQVIESPFSKTVFELPPKPLSQPMQTMMISDSHELSRGLFGRARGALAPNKKLMLMMLMLSIGVIGLASKLVFDNFYQKKPTDSLQKSPPVTKEKQVDNQSSKLPPVKITVQSPPATKGTNVNRATEKKVEDKKDNKKEDDKKDLKKEEDKKDDKKGEKIINSKEDEKKVVDKKEDEKKPADSHKRVEPKDAPNTTSEPK